VSAEVVVRRVLPTVRILWGALLASVGMIGFVAYMVPVDPASANPTLIPVLAVAAAACAVASFVIPGIVSAAAMRARRPEIREPEPRAGFTDASAAQGPQGEFAEPAKAAGQAAAIGMQNLILCLALSEAVGVCGLLAHVFGARLRIAAIFFAAAAALMANRFPTRDSLLGPYERFHKARFHAH